MNTARILVLAIARGAGGAYPNEQAMGVTGAIAQARPTGTRTLTPQGIADDQLAGETGEASRASTSRHGTPIPPRMLN